MADLMSKCISQKVCMTSYPGHKTLFRERQEQEKIGLMHCLISPSICSFFFPNEPS